MANNRTRYTLENIQHASFYQIPKFLFEAKLKKLSNNARVIYTLLRENVSEEDIVNMLGLSDWHLKKAIDQLKEYELIK